MPRSLNTFTVAAIVIPLLLVLALVLVGRMTLRSRLPKAVRVVLLAMEAVIGLGFVYIAVAAVALSMGRWPFPFAPDISLP